jgi:hypothetical protein
MILAVSSYRSLCGKGPGEEAGWLLIYILGADGLPEISTKTPHYWSTGCPVLSEGEVKSG